MGKFDLVQFQLQGNFDSSRNASLLKRHPHVIGDVIRALAPRDGHTVVKFHLQSLTWNVLVRDEDSLSSLLSEYDSEKLLRNLRQIKIQLPEETSAVISNLKLQNVSSIEVDKEFNQVKQESEEKLRRLIEELVSGEIVLCAIDDGKLRSKSTTSSDPESTPGNQLQVNLNQCSQVFINALRGDSEDTPAKSPKEEAEGDSEDTPAKSPKEEAEENMIKAIEKLRKEQRSHYKSNLALEGIDLNLDSKHLPVVHPRIVEFDFFNKNAIEKNAYHPTSEPFLNVQDRGKSFAFDDILSMVEKHKYICLCGFPGSGKTTMAKRLQKSLTDYVCFFIFFEDINYSPDARLTLKELLLDKLFPQLSSSTCADAFNYLLKHNNKVVIILDGYDKVTWSLEENPNLDSYDAQLPICALIAKLLKKQFFPHACIILTTRPHGLINIPKGLRPEHMLLLQDFAPEDMQHLLTAFAGPDAKDVLKVLDEKTPLLKSLCLNPLFLQLYVRAFQKYGMDSSEMQTATRIFSAVLSSMRWSDNMSHPNIETISCQLGRLAFKATRNRAIVVTVKDLHEEQLKIEEVQDLIIPYQNSGIFSETTKLYFSHQTLQEFFAAKHLVSEMSLSDFKTFLNENLFTSSWYVVRGYLCGLLVDINQEEYPTSEKKTFLLNGLKQQMESGPDQRDLVLLCQDIRECNNQTVTVEVAKCLPKRVDLFNTPLDRRNAQCVGFVLKEIASTIDELVLWNCNLNSSSFFFIYDAIRQMPGKIGLLNIRYNNLSSNDVDRICEILNKVENYLWLHAAFVDEVGGKRELRPEERNKLQRAVDGEEDSVLQIVVGEKNEAQNVIKKEENSKEPQLT